MQFIAHPLLAEHLAQPRGPMPEVGRWALALAEALDTVHAAASSTATSSRRTSSWTRRGGPWGSSTSAWRGRPFSDAPEGPHGHGARPRGHRRVHGARAVRGPGRSGRAHGCVLRRRHPLRAAHRPASLLRPGGGRPPGPPLAPAAAPLGAGHVPAALEEVVLCCLAKERSRRYTSARALAVALRQALEHSSETPAHALDSRRRSRPPRSTARWPCSSCAPAPTRSPSRRR